MVTTEPSDLVEVEVWVISRGAVVMVTPWLSVVVMKTRLESVDRLDTIASIPIEASCGDSSSIEPEGNEVGIEVTKDEEADVGSPVVKNVKLGGADLFGICSSMTYFMT